MKEQQTLPDPNQQLWREVKKVTIGLVTVGIIISIGCLLISLMP